MSKAWEEVASVSVVGESVVIGRYLGGNISLKAALAPRRCVHITPDFQFVALVETRRVEQ